MKKLTNSHRPSLLKYHNRHLRLGDSSTAPPTSPLAATSRMPSMTDLNSRLNGLSTPTVAQGWQLTTLASSTAEEKMEIDLEIERLERILGTDVHVWQKRLNDVNEELKGNGVAVAA